MDMCSKCRENPVFENTQSGGVSLKLCEPCKQKIRDLINSPEKVSTPQVLGGAYQPVIA